MKHFKPIILLLLLVMVLTACISIPVGDGNKVKLGKGGFTVISSEGEEVKIDMNEDGLSIQSEDGQESKITFDEKDGDIIFEGYDGDGEVVDFAMGENVGLPDGFLKDMPLTSDANIVVSGENNEELWISYKTSESVDKVDKIYENHFLSSAYSEEPQTYEKGR